VFDGGKGFLRALFNYVPENTNRSLGDFGFTPKGYGILNLYTGIRATDGSWELSLSGSNILNNRTILSETTNESRLLRPFGNQLSGYRTVSFVQRREFQLSFRYAFGSR
jgi:hypothetical protein